jgi:hypothetical protein
MPAPRSVLLALWVMFGVATIGSLAAWVTAVPRVSRQRWDPPPAFPPPPWPDTIRLATAAARLRNGDPFRLDRKPASLRYNPWAPVATTTAPPRTTPPPPTLTLAGIVGGPPWSALIEGIPGRESGVLLTVGEVVNGIRLVRIARDTAHLTGLDTTWVLTPRRAW